MELAKFAVKNLYRKASQKQQEEGRRPGAECAVEFSLVGMLREVNESMRVVAAYCGFGVFTKGWRNFD